MSKTIYCVVVKNGRVVIKIMECPNLLSAVEIMADCLGKYPIWYQLDMKEVILGKSRRN